jgi:nucleoside-diphosphate-sugar epimerase
LNKQITIAGLGWLGKTLAVHLKNSGYSVKGSVTDAAKATSLSSLGIPTFPLLIGENGLSGAPDALLSNTDVLAIMIPPGLRKNTGANYALKMAHFLHHIEKSKVNKVILISSTAVYDDSQGIVTENVVPKPQTNAAKQLFDVEQIFFNTPAFATSIVRFGGLFGGNRNPVRFLAGREGLTNGAAPVNLIHREDCIGILEAIIAKDAFGHIFNAVAPQHPTKKRYYIEQATQLNLSPPTYTDGQSEMHKTINSVNIKEVLDYTFKVPL